MTPEKGTSAEKVTWREAKEEVDKVCTKVQKTSDNAGEDPTPGFSLRHKTFSALNYAQDFGTTVNYEFEVGYTHSLTHSLTHSFTHSLTHSCPVSNTFMPLSALSLCLSHRCKQ